MIIGRYNDFLLFLLMLLINMDGTNLPEHVVLMVSNLHPPSSFDVTESKSKTEIIIIMCGV